jgi:BirA family biotin operon repressor/biotin-[acetyl-CoA-carboxylase] ligase
MTAGISRLERFGRVASTQDIVRQWLDAGQPEVCVAVADEQSAGRGRLDRTWQAPPGVALLLSVGFRPADLAPEQGWRLAAVVGLAMVDAVRELHGATSALALKWPNDLVARRGDGIAKVGGVLGESFLDAEGRLDAAVVGIGVNADWPAADFPAELAGTMGSLREVVGGPVDRERLLEAFLVRLVAAYVELSRGAFPADRWARSQVTTGATVELDLGGGGRDEGTAVGVDPDSGALLVRGPDGPVHAHLSGDVVRCRLRSVEGHV